MKDKLYICGSLCRIYDTNYYERKCKRFLDNNDVIIIYDDIVFHDDYEFKYLSKISNKNNLKKYEKFLLHKIKRQTKNKIKVLSWHSLVKDDVKLIDFLLKIDSCNLQIDMIKCPICGKQHKGPFKCIDDIISLPCGDFELFKLKNINFRIKKGFLQFFVVNETHEKVLINEKYYIKYRDFIKEKKINKNIVVFKEDSFIEEKRTNNSSNKTYIEKEFAINGEYKSISGKMLKFRHVLKIKKMYKLADLIRKIFSIFGYVIIDNRESYILKKVIKKEENKK